MTQRFNLSRTLSFRPPPLRLKESLNIYPSHLCSRLGHGVQSAAVLEPLNLGLVVRVLELDLEGLAVLGVDDHGDGLANGQLGGEDVDLLQSC